MSWSRRSSRRRSAALWAVGMSWSVRLCRLRPASLGAPFGDFLVAKEAGSRG
jgi:hypothetical protein